MLHCAPRPRPLPSQARPSQAPGWVPVFHLTAPQRVRRWSRWSSWHDLSEPGKTTASQSPGSCRPSDSAMRFSLPKIPPGSRASGSIKVADAPVLRAEIAVLLEKDAIELIPPADIELVPPVRVYEPLLHCAKEKQRVTTNLGSESVDPCASQAAVQDVDAEIHFRVRPSPRLVCSDRPEGCALSCLNPPMTGHLCDSRSRAEYVSTSSCLLSSSAS